MRNLAEHPEIYSINTATLGHRQPLEAIIEQCAARGIGAIAPWRREVEGRDATALARHLRDAGLKVSGYCRSTFFPQPDATTRTKAVADNVAALEQAMILGADCFVLVVGGLPDGSRNLSEARNQVVDGVSSLLEHAQARGVRLALEPLHPMTTADRSCLNTIEQALDWCDVIDPANSGYLGIAVDAYHVWWDPKLEEQIVRGCRDKRIYGFHVSDWLVPTRDLVMDRGMMGDGVINLRQIRGWLEQGGYAGAVEVEIFSAEHWWKRPPEETLDVCVSRLATIC